MSDVVAEVVKRPGCRFIRLQGGGSLTVPYALFREKPLRPGDPIDPDAYRQALAPRENRCALEAAVRMLEARDRSSAEIMDKLERQGYSDSAVRQGILRLMEAGYLDDRRFALAFLARAGKKYGAIRLRQELGRKGLPRQLIDELLQGQEEEESLEAAVNLAQKTLRSNAKDPRALYRRAYGVLARRGFPPDIVRKALEAVKQGEEGDGSENG